MPSRAELENLIRTEFRNTEKDFREKIAFLRTLMPSGHVLDFGCSWGYTSWQLERAGYDVTGFEISDIRCTYASTELGIKSISDELELRSPKYTEAFDAVFTSHVLEHLPTLTNTFGQFNRWLKPGGLLMIFVPNGRGKNATLQGVHWGPLVCEKHPLALDAKFLTYALEKHGFTAHAMSDPYTSSRVAAAMEDPPIVAPCLLEGDELAILAYKNSGRSSNH
jgi:SAM-dependent methyltransferase